MRWRAKLGKLLSWARFARWGGTVGPDVEGTPGLAGQWSAPPTRQQVRACRVAQHTLLSKRQCQPSLTAPNMSLLTMPRAACSYQDGAAPPERLREYAACKRLPELPSPLEFLSYLFAAGNLLAGPFFEARDFKDYIERKVSRGGRCGG